MDRSDRPIISVVVPTYQHVNYIEACLTSILEQQLPGEMEILVGEDGSTDGTREVCQMVASKHPGTIRLFLNDRSNVVYIDGAPTGRGNLIDLIMKAKGRFIAFCEGDDRWCDKHKLARQIELLSAEPEASACFHFTHVIDKNGTRLGKTFREHMPARIGIGNIASSIAPFHTSSLVCRNYSFFASLPSWSWKIGSFDMVLFCLLAEEGDLIKLDGIMSEYRKHDGGISEQGSHNLGISIHLHRMMLWTFMAARPNGMRLSNIESVMHEHLREAIRSHGAKAALKMLVRWSVRTFPRPLLWPAMTVRMFKATIGTND